MVWKCFAVPKPATTAARPACPAPAVMTADWSDAYEQILLLVIGALPAIATEKWLHGEDRDKSA